MASGGWGGAFDQRVFRVNVSWISELQRCQTGFHLRDVGINTLDPEDVATEVADWVTESFSTILHATDTIVGVDAENLVSREGYAVSFSNLTGARTDDPLPSFVTCAVSIKGTLRRRYGNGRMLWPVRGEQWISGSSLDVNGRNGYNAVVANLAGRFIGPAITTSMHLVHLHGQIPANSAHGVVEPTWYDATSLRLNTQLSSLRRRKVGVGS